MRYTEFRGKRTDTGEWVSGCLIYKPDSTVIYVLVQLSP